MLLVNPWIVDFAAYDFWIKPLGLLRIASVLTENGYVVELLDCLDRNHPELLRQQGLTRAKSRSDGTGRFFKEIIPKPPLLKSIPRRYGRYGLPLPLVKDIISNLSAPDVILVTSGMTYWYPGVVEMITLLKERFRGVPVVLGGIYASLCHDHARRVSGADVIIQGQGEFQALRILDEITGRSSDPDRYRMLDDVPPPQYDLYEQLDSAALLTSQGCPHRCPFCASHLLCEGMQRRSSHKVADEIAALLEKHGVSEFAFYDDALFYEKEKHIVPILEEVVERNLSIHFHTPNGIQPREVDDELAALMFQTGFKTIRLSYETSDDTRQRRMGLKVTDADLFQAVKYLLDAGFHRRQIGAYVLMGLPGQEIREVVDSLLFVLGLGIKVSLASFSPIPGTTCWKEAVHLGVLKDDADPLLSNNSLFPMRSEALPYKTFIRLGTLASTANRLIQQRKHPLRDAAFRSLLDDIGTFSP